MKSVLRVVVAFLLMTSFGALAAEDAEVTSAKAKKWAVIDQKPLFSSIHHAVMKFKDQKPPYAQYRPDQIVHIAETLLAYQNGDGGWPVNVDWTRVYTETELAELPNGREGADGKRSTLDNDNVWSQIGYLAQVYRQTEMRRYADAAVKGLDYVLREQRPSGGWRGADVEAITFNDNVMAGVLRTLRTICDDLDLYDFVDDARRAKADAAYRKGIRCTLDCQIKVEGRLTAWCEQHDHDTLAPIWARTFEPPSITPKESVDIVRLLMEIPNPAPEVQISIRAAAAWFDRVKLDGVRVVKVPAEPVTFKWHYSDHDVKIVKDPSAPLLWARYYDLEEERPLFCNREYRLTRQFSDLERERRTGMPWHGGWPEPLLKKEYPKWEKRMQTRAAATRVFVIGDSTASRYGLDAYPRMGWAQVLQDYFDSSKIIVEDHARSGRSSLSFREEGHWKKVLDDVRKGDYVFIQFGHNDAKKADPKRYADPETAYPALLRQYIGDVREKGAVPVLLTSINRNHWTSDTELKDSLGGYPPSMRKVASETGVVLFDLHAMTRELFKRMGRRETNTLFMNLEKGESTNYPEGARDNTHLREKGAREVARLVMSAILQSELGIKDAILKP